MITKASTQEAPARVLDISSIPAESRLLSIPKLKDFLLSYSDIGPDRDTFSRKDLEEILTLCLRVLDGQPGSGINRGALPLEVFYQNFTKLDEERRREEMIEKYFTSKSQK